MKYTKINCLYGDCRARMEMQLACTRCGKTLDGNEKFCSECGAALKPLPTKISESVICQLLNAHRDVICEPVDAEPGKKKG